MQVVLASGNQGKLIELQRLLAPLGLDVVTQQSLGIIGEYLARNYKESKRRKLYFVNEFLRTETGDKDNAIPKDADHPRSH